MSYIPSENGRKVNMIKQKFEQNLKTGTSPIANTSNDDEHGKDNLRRSLSASPVKIKKNLKLNVTRQLSNPGKNIKRTPAFRGDKLNKIKNLQSPSKEKIFSIVNQNVKMFEEQPEYGKIGNVKKKLPETIAEKELNCGNSECDENYGTDVVDYIDKNKYQQNGVNKNCRPPLTKDKKVISENTVRTTVISRQKNISPIYSLDDNLGSSCDHDTPKKIEKNPATTLNKFLMNGVEYTKVTKTKTATNDESIESFTNKFHQDKPETTVDIREELSRRKPSLERDEQTNVNNETTVTKYNVDTTSVQLTDSLKAALEAPLPDGPPPKKPPRTFAHSPVTRRYNNSDETDNVSRSRNKKLGDTKCVPVFNILQQNPSDDESSDVKEIPQERSRLNKEFHMKTSQFDERLKANHSLSPSVKSYFLSDDIPGHSPTTTKCRTARDSKKMLEKLETVLIQHQKALGPKVIVPRKEKLGIDSDFDYRHKTGSETDLEKHQDKRKFYNRLSRTLEDSKKSGLEKKNQDTKNRKHSTFDCLPYLNCASSTVYEQPNFTSYFADSLADLKSRSEDSLHSSISNVLSNNTDVHDEQMSPTSKRLSTELTTFLDGKRRQSATKSEERVYAEPFTFDKNSGTDIIGFGELSPEEHNYLSRSWHSDAFSKKQCETLMEKPNVQGGKKQEELHYLCTPIESTVLEDNNNAPKADTIRKVARDPAGFPTFFDTSNSPSRSYLDGPDQAKVEQLLNQAFGPFTMAGTEISTDSNTSSDTDSIASTPSTNDELASFNEKLQLFKSREGNVKPSKEELHRSLTEKRKHYVRRVSIKYSEKRDGSLRERRNRLFEVCLLVELNLSTKEPYIKDKYPIYAKAPAWIENFCFPDAQDWPPSDSNHNQFYSLFLMDEHGNRRYGYCYRVKPEGGPILPLAYCLITKFRASGFYHKVLQELESRHGLPDKRRRNFIEELYNCQMPKPGNSLKMTTDRVELSTNDRSPSNNNLSTASDINKVPATSMGKNTESTTALMDCEKLSAAALMESLNDSYSSESIIIRSGDPRLEERDMSQLFDAVSNKVLIFLFGSLLLERRVVLMCDKLSKLSSCVEALQSLLYPFTWPHTFIPVLPDIPELSEILQAPLPFVIGVLKSKNPANTQVNTIQDGIVVDLDTSKIVCAMGDESTILPTRLQKGIRSALQLVSSNTKPGDGIRNFLVSEAFLRVFVETCAHLEGHLVTQQDGKIIFQKESFVKASSSKTVQYFLEWLVETTMFNTFVMDYIAWVEGTTVGEKYDIKLFAQRVAEHRRAMEKSAQSKKNSSKKKTFGDRLKDLTNFYT